MWSFANRAQAGNSDGILLGNDAALSGGAVTAMVGDGSSLWYNPAGLMNVDRDTVDLSATAYSLRIYKVPRAIFSDAGDKVNGDVNEVVIVPSALSYVRPLGKSLRLGFGIFTTASNDYSQRATLDVVDASGFSSVWKIAAANEVSLYHGVMAVAFRPSESIHLGFGFHIFYAGVFEASQAAGGVFSDRASGSTVLSLTESSITSVTGVGVRFSAGVQLKLSDALYFGAAFQSASYLVFTSVSNSSTSTLSFMDPVNPANSSQQLQTSETDMTDVVFDEIEPYRARFGIGIVFDRGWLGIDADLQWLATENVLGRRDFEVEVNGRVGGIFDINDSLRFGLGVFTDRAFFNSDVLVLGDAEIDYYGVSTGIQFHKTRRFSEDEREDDITFSTTIGLRYAYGSGDYVALRIPRDLSAEDTSSAKVGITAHELSIHVGGDIRF